MVGQQTKYSDMVKGKQHDQTFDETLEFVLAAGKQQVPQNCLHKVQSIILPIPLGHTKATSLCCTNTRLQ